MTTDGSDEQANVFAEGDVITHERTFTAEDVREFGKITGDQQSIHTDSDEEGRLVVHGLLTGSLMTKIGGDLSYVARTMEYEFRDPDFDPGDEVVVGDVTGVVRDVDLRKTRLEVEGGDVVVMGNSSVEEKWTKKVEESDATAEAEEGSDPPARN